MENDTQPLRQKGQPGLLHKEYRFNVHVAGRLAIRRHDSSEEGRKVLRSTKNTFRTCLHHGVTIRL